MDDSLVSLVDETQNTEDNSYLIELNLSIDERNMYSIILFILSIIINVIFISIYKVSININIILNILYVLLNGGIIYLTFKNNYIEKIKDNIILLVLLVISIIFDMILSINNNEKQLTLIFIFIIKNIIVGYYIKNNL